MSFYFCLNQFQSLIMDTSVSIRLNINSTKFEIGQSRYKEHTNPIELCFGLYYLLSSVPQKLKTEDRNSLHYTLEINFSTVFHCF